MTTRIFTILMSLWLFASAFVLLKVGASPR